MASTGLGEWAATAEMEERRRAMLASLKEVMRLRLEYMCSVGKLEMLADVNNCWFLGLASPESLTKET